MESNNSDPFSRFFRTDPGSALDVKKIRICLFLSTQAWSSRSTRQTIGPEWNCRGHINIMSTCVSLPLTASDGALYGLKVGVRARPPKPPPPLSQSTRKQIANWVLLCCSRSTRPQRQMTERGNTETHEGVNETQHGRHKHFQKTLGVSVSRPFNQ